MIKNGGNDLLSIRIFYLFLSIQQAVAALAVAAPAEAAPTVWLAKSRGSVTHCFARPRPRRSRAEATVSPIIFCALRASVPYSTEARKARRKRRATVRPHTSSDAAKEPSQLSNSNSTSFTKATKEWTWIIRASPPSTKMTSTSNGSWSSVTEWRSLPRPRCCHHSSPTIYSLFTSSEAG